MRKRESWSAKLPALRRRCSSRRSGNPHRSTAAAAFLAGNDLRSRRAVRKGGFQAALAGEHLRFGVNIPPSAATLILLLAPPAPSRSCAVRTAGVEKLYPTN